MATWVQRTSGGLLGILKARPPIEYENMANDIQMNRNVVLMVGSSRLYRVRYIKDRYQRKSFPGLLTLPPNLCIPTRSTRLVQRLRSTCFLRLIPSGLAGEKCCSATGSLMALNHRVVNKDRLDPPSALPRGGGPPTFLLAARCLIIIHPSRTVSLFFGNEKAPTEFEGDLARCRPLREIGVQPCLG